MGNTFYFEWEVRLMEWLQGILSPFGTGFFSAVAALGEELALVAVLGVFYWCIDKNKGKYLGYNMILCGLLFPMAKNIALRRRPYWDHETIQILKPVDPDADIYDIAAQGYSFPSGHSANAVSCYGSIARIYRKKWLSILCVVIPFLVGISRFALGAHYPTDVLFGWALGTVIIFGLPALREKINNEKLFQLLLFLVALPGLFFCRTTDYFTALGMLIGFFAGSAFEEKKVGFRKPEKKRYWVTRTAGGIAVFFLLSTLLKLPFSESFLASASPACLAVRVLRYAIIIFADLGIYPMLFRFEK